MFMNILSLLSTREIQPFCHFLSLTTIFRLYTSGETYYNNVTSPIHIQILPESLQSSKTTSDSKQS